RVVRSVHFFFQAEDGIRDRNVTGVQTCALPIFDVQKQAEGKSNRGGRKFAARRMDHDVASAEVVATGTEPNWDASHRPLLVKMEIGRASCREGVGMRVGEVRAERKVECARRDGR